MILYNQIKENAYYDSVTLMVISSKIAGLEGVKDAAVMMGTDHNKDLMKNSGLLSPGNENVNTSDMIIGILAENQEIIDRAMEIISGELDNKKTVSADGEVRVKTLESAIKRVPDLNFAVISVPGRYAKNEAMKALNNNLNVLLFSDNVTIEEENELKDLAIEKGLLMMGPDCGTAIINGTSLGFANGINRGKIGLVSAAGTGLQEVSVIIDKLGGGISQALGTGGRDLKDEIGGKTMIFGLNALIEDEDTKVIVLISKPPSPRVMKKVLDAVKNTDKPVVTCFLGGDTSLIKEYGVIPAETLEDAATAAVMLSKGKTPENTFFTISNDEVRKIVENEVNKLEDSQTYVRGLYSGGTICYEGMLIMKETIGDVYSNVPLKKEFELNNLEISKKNTFLDMGEDDFTDGLPHPMIDTRLRVERIKQEGLDPETALILLDVVLGYGSHQDPAGAIVPAIIEAKENASKEGRHLSVVASICGTDMDPQNKEEQEEKLRNAGVIIMPSNAQAARMASLILTRGKHLEELLGGE